MFPLLRNGVQPITYFPVAILILVVFNQHKYCIIKGTTAYNCLHEMSKIPRVLICLLTVKVSPLLHLSSNIRLNNIGYLKTLQSRNPWLPTSNTFRG